MVLVSVLMASYNHGLYIGEAIESVLNQTFPDLELIVLDDCSTDNSREIIADYQAKDKRVKAIFHQKNAGIGRTFNDSIKEAQGEYVSFIGSDDLWVPNKLEKQIAVAKKFPQKVIWSEGEIINGQGVPLNIKVTQRMFAPKKKSGNLFQELLKEDIVFGQSAILKTEYAQRFGLDETFNYVNDHLFFVNLARLCEFHFMDESLAKYRVHGKNASLRNEEIWYNERIRLRKLFIDRFGSEIRPESLSDIYYKIGHAFLKLNQTSEAQHYFLKAIAADPMHLTSGLYLMLALTARSRRVSESSAKCYYTFTSFFN